MTVQEYLDAKYSAGGPGSARFEPDADEVHASQLSDCQRKRFWKHDRNHRAGPSPYFELGRVFEVMYGAALAFEHDPEITTNVLKRNPPWEVVEKSTYVQQDVGVTIDLGDCEITGECDWVVLDESCPSVEDPEKYAGFSEVAVEQTGSRHALFESGDGLGYDDAWIRKVVETKTKSNVDWVRRDGPDESHVYQVYPYIHGLECEGEIAYMQRNDWEELVVPLEYDEDRWLDCLMRAKQHSANMNGDSVPPASPLDKKECKFCPFRHDCAAIGGSPHL